MKVHGEFAERLEDLRKILERELNRELDKTSKREHFPAEVEYQNDEIVIVRTEMYVERGGTLDVW